MPEGPHETICELNVHYCHTKTTLIHVHVHVHIEFIPVH